MGGQNWLRRRLRLAFMGGQIFMLLFMGVLNLQASGLQAAMFQHRNTDGSISFSDTPMVNGRLERRRYQNDYGRPTATASCTGLNRHQLDERGELWRPDIERIAKLHGLEPPLLLAVARAESCFDVYAESAVGAQGLLQLMPTTARELGVSNSFDPLQNLDGGARYLAQMLKRFNQDQTLALAAYNAGPGNVDRYKGVPPFPETRKYIERVSNHIRRYTDRHSSSVSGSEDSLVSATID